MSNLIDRDEVLKLIETTISHPVQVRWIRAKINSLPLQQQWGNEKIEAQKELIEFYEHMLSKRAIFLVSHWFKWLDADIMKWAELRNKAENLPPNN